jgi:DNA mismatch repair ATPase MutS
MLISVVVSDQFLMRHFSSLQIFEDEKHASVHSDRTKEGLSLFGILNNTQTTLGRSLLRAWLLRPSLSLSVIKARHDAVSCFTDPANLVVADGMHRHLKGVKNVPRILSMMKSGRAKIGDWQGLIKFTFHAVMIKDALTELFGAKDVEIVNKVTHLFFPVPAHMAINGRTLVDGCLGCLLLQRDWAVGERYCEWTH